MSTPSFTLAVPVDRTDHIEGPANAGVTLVEYGDFECPNCAQAYHAVNMLRKHFAGRLRFVFRQYPLREVHPHAELAAEAAEASGAQGKFWQMHALLFENQQHLKLNSLRQYAAKLELDLARFDFELEDHVYLQRVQEHVAGGRDSGIRGTPAFFVNGILHDVSFGFEALQAAIDAALRG
jgi:protein-disulfide isomerase